MEQNKSFGVNDDVITFHIWKIAFKALSLKNEVSEGDSEQKILLLLIRGKGTKSYMAFLMKPNQEQTVIVAT